MNALQFSGVFPTSDFASKDYDYLVTRLRLTAGALVMISLVWSIGIPLFAAFGKPAALPALAVVGP